MRKTSLVSFLVIALGACGLAACSGPAAGVSDDVRVDVTQNTEPRIIGGSPLTSAQDATVFIDSSATASAPAR